MSFVVHKTSFPYAYTFRLVNGKFMDEKALRIIHIGRNKNVKWRAVSYLRYKLAGSAIDDFYFAAGFGKTQFLSPPWHTACSPRRPTVIWE